MSGALGRIPVWVCGIGSCIPRVREVRTDLEGTTRVARVAVADEMSAPDLALTAARRALTFSKVGVRDIRLLIYCDVWHQGPDGWMPHSYLQRHLRLDHASAFEMKAGCTGGLAALDVGAAYLGGLGDPRACVMIVTSDNFGTSLVDRWCMGPFQGAVGDGASAVILSCESGLARLLSTASSTLADLEEVHRGDDPLFPPSVTEGRRLDFGARARQYESRALRKGIWLNQMLEHADRMKSVLQESLATAGILPEEVARLHMPSMPTRIALDYASALGFPIERTSHEFSISLGHLGASDQFLALEHDLRRGQLREGDHVVMIGNSPGVTYRAAALRIEREMRAEGGSFDGFYSECVAT